MKYENKDHEIEALRSAKDNAYTERNHLVCYLSKIFPSYLERHPEADKEWKDDWRWIVFLYLPTGQATWHIHDSHLSMFDHLKRNQGKVWDGHTTEEKYERMQTLKKGFWVTTRPSPDGDK
jgi:hypothetical protein